MKLVLPSLGWHVKFKRELHEYYDGPLGNQIEKANSNILEEPYDEAILRSDADVAAFVSAGATRWVRSVYYWTNHTNIDFPEDSAGKVIDVCMGRALVFQDRDACLDELARMYEPVAWLRGIATAGPPTARPLAVAVLDGDRETLAVLADALEDADHPRAADFRALADAEAGKKPRKKARKPAKAAPVATAQEVVLVGGFPASGKSTHTRSFLERGYERLNRDERGGTMDGLLRPLAELLAAGKSVVLDNLFATKEGRAPFVAAARKAGVPVRFLLMGTGLEDAQFNASLRMLETHGRLLMPEEHKQAAFKKDPGLFPVHVLYKYKKDFEKPTTAEGFASVETVPFERRYPADWTNKAVLFDLDGTLRESTGAEKYPTKPSEVKAFKDRAGKLRKLRKDGYLLLGVSNQSGVAKGKLTKEDAEKCFAETAKQLGVKFEAVAYCPHAVPPISCYCRKPNPGLGVQLLWTYKLDPRKCLVVGDLGTDRSFAERCGIPFVDQAEFFS